MHDDDPDAKQHEEGVSRRTFLKASGIPLAAVPVLIGPQMVRAADAEVAVHGPGKARFTLTVNGQARPVEVEPRVTLLDALRQDLDVTGAKRVCDRGTCGACTMLVDGRPVYACSMLAIDAQGHKITTVESLAGSTLHPLQQAFVDKDGLQCGFCTPGFVMACKALLDKNPKPARADLEKGLAGNVCRCGTYVGIREAVAAASQGGTRG
jgi:xanthine dehydrogenase YagT iron-sulfur-binding subunit